MIDLSGAGSIKFATNLSVWEPQRVSSGAPRKRDLVAISGSEQGEKNKRKGSDRGRSRYCKAQPSARTASECLTEPEANCTRKSSIYQFMTPAPEEN